MGDVRPGAARSLERGSSDISSRDGRSGRGSGRILASYWEALVLHWHCTGGALLLDRHCIRSARVLHQYRNITMMVLEKYQ